MRHPLHEVALSVGPRPRPPTDEDALRALRAQYYGMISEVDFQLGRVVRRSKSEGSGATRSSSSRPTTATNSATTASSRSWASSPRATTSSGCGETLGCPVDAPSRHFTENVDLLPTLADALGVERPVQCDGRSLAPLFAGEDVEVARSGALRVGQSLHTF